MSLVRKSGRVNLGDYKGLLQPKPLIHQPLQTRLVENIEQACDLLRGLRRWNVFVIERILQREIESLDLADLQARLGIELVDRLLRPIPNIDYCSRASQEIRPSQDADKRTQVPL